MDRQIGGVDAEDPHRARRRPVEAGNRVEERGLAGAVRPDQTDDLAFVHRQRHVVDRHQPAEPHRDAIGFQQWRAAIVAALYAPAPRCGQRRSGGAGLRLCQGDPGVSP